ncbi:MAG: ferrous iron transport protein B [candidate division Zixibacteria bacterium]|nr:ferrous iron transport protein B [candidate division Zixibacteria bacterium]
MEPRDKNIVVALIGNPNSGKTTVFNNLTGANQHVGNFPGVTVEKKEGYLSRNGYKIKFVDLPGTYSLSAQSLDEIIARNYIIEEKPDIVIDIVDASNIERNLYLTTQIGELGIPMIAALNMSDMAKNRGILIDSKYLSNLLGVPVIPTVGNKNKGMDELVNAVIDIAEYRLGSVPAKINYGKEFQKEICKLCEIITRDILSVNSYKPNWLALKLLENDDEVIKFIDKHKFADDILKTAKESRARLTTFFKEEPASVITDKRYGFISGACSEATSMTSERRHDLSDSIDYLLIHPTLGLPIFAGLMWLMFHMTFTLGAKPMEWIEWLIGIIAQLASAAIPEGLINSLVVDGIIGGVGGVIVFLPTIMLLFLAIALLEDTGYMARAAFVMDRIMHKIGLHGKSFIPMLIGFGCTVPAYMGCRIIEDRTDRLVTMHVASFMSCSARLPVYILIGGAFWPENAGNVVFSIYALGIVVAVTMIKILRSTRFKGMSSPLVMELPPYRMPTLRSLLLHMWERSWLYLRKAGTVILGISIIMWFLMAFPKLDNYSSNYDNLIISAENSYHDGTISLDKKDKLVNGYESIMAAEDLEYSFAGRLGKIIEPVLKPMGFDWRLGIAIISGFAAKEVVVSTMGTVYGVGEVDEESGSLRDKLASDPRYSKLIAYAFMVFILLYMPCMAAMAVFFKETRSWKELAFQIGYTTALAWLMAFLVYQGGNILGLG